MYNFDPYNVLLVIATNIPLLLKTGVVLQGHIYRDITSVTLNGLFPSERHAEDHRPEEAHLQVSSRRVYLAGEDREHLHPQRARVSALCARRQPAGQWLCFHTSSQR